MGRFLNADVLASTGQGVLGYNMFTYCNNSPLCRKDPSGQVSILLAFAIAYTTIGAINNTINAVYYELSDGQSDLSPDSYQYEKPSRWEKLDYTKKETGDEHYGGNAWRYYSEYSLHEYGWYATQWADKKDIPILSDMAYQFGYANVEAHAWDDWGVNVFIVLWGILGF